MSHDHHGHHQMAKTTIPPMPMHDHGEHGTTESGHHTTEAGHQHSGNGSGMMMHMYFHAGISEVILFEFWKTEEIGTFIASLVIVFLLAFSYEALKYYREHLYRHSFKAINFNTITVPVENGGTIRETHKTVQNEMTFPRNNEDPSPILVKQVNCECPEDKCENQSKTAKSIDYSNYPISILSFPIVNEVYKVKMFSLMHTWQTLLHIIQVIVSYFLMLIFMTYNIWLCIAVALGAGVGYFFFGWKKSLVVDITEHCH